MSTRIRYVSGETGVQVSKPILVNSQVLEVVIAYSGIDQNFQMSIFDKTNEFQSLVTQYFVTIPAAKKAAKEFLINMGAHFEKEVRNREKKSDFAQLEPVRTAEYYRTVDLMQMENIEAHDLLEEVSDIISAERNNSPEEV
jgi:hypothetical protein